MFQHSVDIYEITTSAVRPSVALNDRIFRKVGYEKDKYNRPIGILT